MERKWETPRVLVQEFEPNEYVAVCWGVECDVDWANKYEMEHGRDYWNGVTHDEAHCGNSSNQVIRTDDYGNQRYKDFPITKIEIFGKQSENYDQSAKGELKPFSYDVNENGFDNGYWSTILDVEQILQFCYDNSNQGFDQGYWLSTDGPFGEDLFNHEINNYDDFGPYWIRDEHPELGPYEIDPTTGGILFEGAKAECTYGRWGYRYVTPFIRFYFEEDIGAELDQEVRVVETNDQGEDYVSYVGNVV